MIRFRARPVKAGSKLPIKRRCRPPATEDGGIIGLRVDITELKQREASFRLLFDSNPVPMIVCALGDERILAVNDAAVQHYGYSRSEFEKLTIRSLQAFDAELPWTGDERAARTWKHVRADGTLIDLAIYSRQLVYGDRPAILLALMDTTERKRAEARLTFMAQHDGLTGLPNRNLLRQQMDDILLRTRRNAEQVAVLVLGLDHFKAVNDTLGHGIGDKLLRGVGKRLRSMLREDDALARLNSDEFAIVQSGVTRPEDAAFLARRLLDAIGDPYLLDGHSVVIGASIGIAMSPGDGDESEKLLKNADLALSRAKNDSRGTFSFFEAGMDARAQTRRKIETELREAVQGDTLRPYYQPLVDLSSGRITGFEALVRWPHPERGMISPAEFIPVAEETGLINAVGGLMLRRACTDAAQWPDDVHVAVNLSPLQFRLGNLLSLVTDTLKQSGLPAQAPGTRDHGDAASGKEQRGAGDAACAARARCSHLDGRFRHRLFQPELSAQFSVRQDQDRPVLRARPRRQPRRAGDRAFDHQPRQGPGRHDHGGRRRDRGRSKLPAQRGLPRGRRAFCSAARGPMRRS